MTPLQIALLAFAFSSCAANKDSKCNAKNIAKLFGINPDAWKVIDQLNPRYHLMFHSKGHLLKDYKCLCTTKSNTDLQDKWKKTVKFHSSPNSTTTYHGAYTVGSTKTDLFYVWDNALNATYYLRQDTPLTFSFSQMFSCNDVIYVDLQKCLLMHSPLLGYQVWANTEYLHKNKRIPYVCVYFYEACTGTERNWVYDWTHCPDYTHHLPETRAS